MKGDFSRQTFDPRRHYSGVLMQQGRVQLDADWNEQGAIARYRDETTAADIIGRCGAPADVAGFEITTDGVTLYIGQGRYYVDGILVENDLGKLRYADDRRPPIALAYDDQDRLHLPGANLKAQLAEMAQKGLRFALVYLDVWQRHVTALDDPLLREVALGGPDTTTRLQTVWQVKLLPLKSKDGDLAREEGLQRELGEIGLKLGELVEVQSQLAAGIAQLTAQLESLSPRHPGRSRLQSQLERLRAQLADVQKRHEELAARRQAIESALSGLRAMRPPTCSDRFLAWDKLSAPVGLLNARAVPAEPADDPCELPPGGGYTRLENQLYRVEVHLPGALGQATFKWSRDNGTVVARIERISGNSVFVDNLGPDEVLGFANGQWVELLDDTLELNGQPGQLARIVDVKAATRELVLDPAPQKLAPAATDGVDPSRHPKVRRWDQHDQPGAIADAHGVWTSAAWLPLEDGVQVQFSLPEPGAAFRTGDYWLIPARTGIGDLEWPPYQVPNLNPQPQPPLGIEHHFCRLALIEVRDGKLTVVEDCRSLFPPLTALMPRQALHVEAINWENDGLLSLGAFRKDGLRIRLDAPPDPAAVSNESVLVTVDVPWVQNNQPSPVIRERLVVLGTVGVDPADPRTIVWRLAEPASPATGDTTVVRPIMGVVRPFRPQDTTAETVARQPSPYRVNVTLRGRFIWRTLGSRRLYLDGQAFGRPVSVAGRDLVRTGLVLPSGDRARASDFESWFFLGSEQLDGETLRVREVVFSSAVAGRPSRVVLAVEELPLDPQKVPMFKAEERVNQIQVFFTRPVGPEGEFPVTEPQSALVELLNPQGQGSRRFGAVTVKGDLLEFRAQDPSFLNEPGTYRLTVFAQDSNLGPGIRAQDDGSALDGDFSGQPGGNFVLSFQVAG